VSTDHREYFYFDKTKGANERVLAPLIDQGVYTNFRCLRMLYSSKMKTGGRAGVPFDGFSAQIKDHLVLVHEDIEQNIISVDPAKLINREIVIDADYSKVNQINITPERVTVLSDDAISENSCDITPNINSTHLKNIEECILRDPSILKMFGDTIRFKYSNFIKPTVYSFMIDKTCGCTCPYANRVHSNNRSYIEYHYKHNMLKYKCFSESCREIQKRECIQFKVRPEMDSLQRLTNLNNIATLHCKQKVITWNETYDRESMLPYPLKRLTCVRGNMGSAKTKCLIEDFVGKNCNHPDTKCLFITYQILLSKKYFNALERYGFVNYMDQNGEINANKVIVCLDSLIRITTTNFDYIFIDEVLSVLLHFNSSLMKQVNRISSMFEFLLLQAKYIYVLDACVDNTIVYDFVNYLATAKTVAPYWIRNTHIRSTNRECKVMINRSAKPKPKSALQYSCFNHVVELLKADKKVVISSSTKAFTKDLLEYIKQSDVKGKNIIVYNSDTDKQIIYEHAMDPNIVWNKYDALIYSPTISAGLSFEMLHFDELVCFINNSLYTPTVDLVLQQMFRVRQLVNGRMTLYLNDSLTLNPIDHPVSSDVVEDWLDRNMMMIQNYFPNNAISYDSPSTVSSKGCMYDKSRLSYRILKGIVLNMNKSLLKFTDTIVNTLKEDYNVKCHVQEYEPSDTVLMEAQELFEELKKDRVSKEIKFAESLIITSSEYEKLANKRESQTDEEKMKKWIYEIAINLWRIPRERIDEGFFDQFIGQYELKHIKSAFAKFYRGLRYKELENTLVENRERLHESIQSLVQTSRDFNLDLFKTKTTKYYEMLLEGQYLLEKVFNIKGRLEGDKMVCLDKDIHIRFKEYADGLQPDRWDNIKRMFDLESRNYSSLSKLKESRVNQHGFIKQILKGAFDMEYRTENRGTQCRRGLSMKWYEDLLMKYKPRSMIPIQTGWSFVDEEGYDPLED
jgi:hypothetical protein